LEIVSIEDKASIWTELESGRCSRIVDFSVKQWLPTGTVFQARLMPSHATEASTVQPSSGRKWTLVKQWTWITS